MFSKLDANILQLIYAIIIHFVCRDILLCLLNYFPITDTFFKLQYILLAAYKTLFFNSQNSIYYFPDCKKLTGTIHTAQKINFLGITLLLYNLQRWWITFYYRLV